MGNNTIDQSFRAKQLSPLRRSFLKKKEKRIGPTPYGDWQIILSYGVLESQVHCYNTSETTNSYTTMSLTTMINFVVV